VDLHLAFNLAHPDAFSLKYNALSAAASAKVIHEVLRCCMALVLRIAEAGRLVSMLRRQGLIYAAGTGVTLTLIATPPANATRDSPRPCARDTYRHHRSGLRQRPKRRTRAAPDR